MFGKPDVVIAEFVKSRYLVEVRSIQCRIGPAPLGGLRKSNITPNFIRPPLSDFTGYCNRSSADSRRASNTEPRCASLRKRVSAARSPQESPHVGDSGRRIQHRTVLNLERLNAGGVRAYYDFVASAPNARVLVQVVDFDHCIAQELYRACVSSYRRCEFRRSTFASLYA